MNNTLVENEFETLKDTMALKSQLLAILTDEHLGTKLGGNTMSLGEVCREMGEVQQGYIDSFRNFKQNWHYKHGDKAVESSMAALKAWNEKLDADLLDAIANLSNEDIQNRTIDRGGFSPNPHMQVHIFRESILIFCAKVSIYLRALQIELPEQWKSWIG